ncbi:LysM domain-containing protein [Lutibacter sp. Hel_I_33_5]|uniref:amino acid ABC transporter substrate-binding protein n=1 Tax=Lutibacter sp. Hel_I_33_5 TaxID=1566289 RepID=UPI0011A13CFC|nr:LysM peptidoglycan-binding domain-containing protein [Lutibacter sp. Hel_I_33_5]TVZ55474.1 LysM domain-containing protein [Lutibacter sp. Hel_I_33_5]
MGIEHMKHLKVLVFLCVLTFAVSCGQQKKYVEYTVKKGETIRTIAKNLDIKTRDLLKLNPDVSRRPEANTVIKIPNKKFNTAVSEEKITEKKDSIIAAVKDPVSELDLLKKQYVVHKVKPKETIYGLKRFYNVTEEDLMNLNPFLFDGLKIGQIIKIKPINEGEEVENLIYKDSVQDNATLKLALLLPFRANEYDSISSKTLYKNNRLANIVSDFYLGAELAIDSLKQHGVLVYLNVFDTGKKNSKIKRILSENDLEENDAIIGPLYSDEAKVLANNISKTPVIFPVYSKSQSKFSSTDIIKTAPERKEYVSALVDYIKENYTEGTITVVGDNTEDSNYDLYKVKNSLTKHDSINVVYQISPKKGYIKKDRFLEVLKPSTNNWVVLATKDNVVASDAINSLISLPDSTSVKVFALDKATTFDKIDNRKLAKIGFTFVTDTYIDETSYATQRFNQMYFDKNKALPSYYATKGFDITYDILMRLASGNSLKSTFKKGASYRVESKFDYSKKTFSTSENKGLFIVQFNPDLSITRLK